MFEYLLENNISKEGFLEYVKYGVNYYGTPKKAIEENINEGKSVILKIEVQGAENIKKLYPDSVGIFLLPPSMEVLENRLRSRGTEDEDDIKKRLEIAYNEIKKSKLYDYFVINDSVENAVRELNAIMTAEHCKPQDRMEVLGEE